MQSFSPHMTYMVIDHPRYRKPFYKYISPERHSWWEASRRGHKLGPAEPTLVGCWIMRGLPDIGKDLLVHQKEARMQVWPMDAYPAHLTVRLYYAVPLEKEQPWRGDFERAEAFFEKTINRKF